VTLVPDNADALAKLDWVRPVATAMRAVAIPEPVVQLAMLDLLNRLDAHLETALPGRKNIACLH